MPIGYIHNASVIFGHGNIECNEGWCQLELEESSWVGEGWIWHADGEFWRVVLRYHHKIGADWPYMERIGSQLPPKVNETTWELIQLEQAAAQRQRQKELDLEDVPTIPQVRFVAPLRAKNERWSD